MTSDITYTLNILTSWLYPAVNEKLPLPLDSYQRRAPPATAARFKWLAAIAALSLNVYCITQATSLRSLFLQPFTRSIRVDTELATTATSYKPAASCPVQVEPRNIGEDWRPEDDQEYVKLAVERLQGAVQIVSPPVPRPKGAMRLLTPPRLQPTESFDNMNDNPEEEPRFEIMAKLHEYLATTFPLL